MTVGSGVPEQKEMTAGFRYYVISGNRYPIVAPSTVAVGVKEGDTVDFLVSTSGKITDICVQGTRTIHDQDISQPGTGQRAVPPPAGYVPQGSVVNEQKPSPGNGGAMACYQKDNSIILRSSLKVAADVFRDSPEYLNPDLSYDERLGIVEHGALRLARFVVKHSRDINA
jgi:hypothetical protein